MTEEVIKKAYDYMNTVQPVERVQLAGGNVVCIKFNEKQFIEAYGAGYEQVTEEIQKGENTVFGMKVDEIAAMRQENAELKAEIEKLKVCGSCKYVCYSALEDPCIHCANCFACKDKSHNKWELAE